MALRTLGNTGKIYNSEMVLLFVGSHCVCVRALAYIDALVYLGYSIFPVVHLYARQMLFLRKLGFCSGSSVKTMIRLIVQGTRNEKYRACSELCF